LTLRRRIITIVAPMRRLASILVLASVALLGSGALSYLHDLSHAIEDSQAAASATRRGDPAAPAPVHNEANCLFHAILRAPGLAAGPVPLLIFFGLLVAFLTLLAPRPVSVRVPRRIHCRGPPSHPSLLPA
jgi:hypothetical protein